MRITRHWRVACAVFLRMLHTFFTFPYVKRALVFFLLIPLAPSAGLAKDALLYTPSVTVSNFEATARTDDSSVQVHWQTTSEFGVQAFRLLRQRDSGAWEPVGPGYVRTLGQETGSTYKLADPLVQVGDTVCYALLIVSRHGPDQQVAEWSGVIEMAAVEPRHVLVTAAASAVVPSVTTALAQSWIGSSPRVRVWTNSVPADRVRLSLREEGIYHVSALDLAEASGWDVASVATAIANTNLSLSCQGSTVAWYADGDNLFFYGVSAQSRFAPENVYWITRESGSNMSQRVITPEETTATNAWFNSEITRQGTDYLARVSFSTLADSPASYVAFYGPIFAGSSLTLNETLTDCATGIWHGTVTVNLLSYYEVGADEHAVQVSIGGTAVGGPSWMNEQYVSFTYPFSSTNLADGTAVLRLENMGISGSTDTSVFLCMSYGFSYPSLYRARNGALRCTVGNSNTVAVSGFSTNDIVVLDVTVTNAPVVVEPVTCMYDSASNRWTAAFSCGGSGQVYQVFSTSAGVRQPSLRGVRDVDWSASTNAADYVILVPPEAWRDGFRQAMQPLADYRNAQGLRTKIVDVEALYNAFSYGLVDPLAIRAFCAAVYPNGLNYLLLAGAGALDFKHQRLSVNDYTACLIPTLIAGQRFSNGDGMTVALDAALGDVDGDGVPDVAVGRLPTTKTNELTVVVQKTIAYEGVLRWKQQASVAADWDNTGDKYYPFSAGTDRLLVPLANAGRTVVKHYIYDSTSGADVRYGSLFPALRAGSGLFHFFGHANEQSLGAGNDRLLYNANITPANWQKPTIAVLICCRPNRWQSLTTTVCLLPQGLFASDTGFVAGLGATGFMLGDEGESLAVGLYTAADGQGRAQLGDVLRRGMQRMVGTMPSERLLCYSLVGDPALVFDYTPPYGGTALFLQ